MAKPDWAAIEIDYRAGQLSNRALAEKYGVSDTAIRKKAKAEGWEKALVSSHKEVRTANQNANLRTSAENLIEDEELTPLQASFVLEYIKDKNATKAAERIGCSDPNYGRELLAKTSVLNAINRQLKALAETTLITEELILNRLWEIATANPNELIDHRLVNCRYCHGVEHEYQWKREEYRQAQEKARRRDDKEPDCSGGFGFDELKEPHPDCPECHGRGVGRVVPHDTRKIKGPAAKLLAGVKLGKDGLEIKMHDQIKALDMLSKKLELMKERTPAPNNNSGSRDNEDGFGEDYRLELKPDENIPDKPIL